MKMKDAIFEKLREGIFQELLKANLHFDIFWKLRTARKEVADIRNVYLTFFVYTMRAHNDCFCIAINNVTKYDSKTSNFPRLLCYIKNSSVLSEVFSSDQIDNMFDTLHRHDDLIERIKVARNQYIAHNQLKKNHLGITLKYKYEEGKTLLEDLAKMFNALSRQYDRQGFYFDIIPHLNIEDMLNDLTKYRQSQLNNLKRLVNQP
jgi:hypothetical protein